MSRLIEQPTETAQWHALVNEAAVRCEHRLAQELESYLVFMLIRHTRYAELASHIMAQDYLQSAHQPSHLQRKTLRDVGDSCLLLSGLFPERASRLRLRVGYFVDVGQSAYQVLGTLSSPLCSTTDNASSIDMYQHLATQFVPLMDVLHAMRDLNPSRNSALSPLQALEIWEDTGSRYAQAILRRHAIRQ